MYRPPLTNLPPTVRVDVVVARRPADRTSPPHLTSAGRLAIRRSAARLVGEISARDKRPAGVEPIDRLSGVAASARAQGGNSRSSVYHACMHGPQRPGRRPTHGWRVGGRPSSHLPAVCDASTDRKRLKNYWPCMHAWTRAAWMRQVATTSLF
jgi:hypothetical protein